MEQSETEDKTQPATHIKVQNIEVPIWTRAAKDGRTYYEAGQPVASYKDAQGEWHTRRSFRGLECLAAAKAFSDAQTWIDAQGRK